MRLTLVVARYLPHLGGIEIHVAELAHRAAAAGLKVTVATISPKESCGRTAEDGVEVLRFPGRFKMAGHELWSPALWSYVEAGADGADVIHVHNYHAPTVLPAVIKARTKVVFTPHYLGVSPHPRARAEHAAYRKLAGPILRRANPSIIHVSNHEAVEFRRDLGGPVSDDIHVIPNGVRVDELRQAEPIISNGPLVLLASRIEAYKQPQAVLAAIRELPTVHVAVAGDGPHLPTLRRLAEEYQVSERVTFLGRLDWPQLTRWYRAADVFVSMSTRECYGMAVAEALAAGAGVVASDIPSHREVVTAAGYPTQFLLPVSASAEELASAIGTAMGMRVSPGARPVPTWDQMTDSVLAVYG